MKLNLQNICMYLTLLTAPISLYEFLSKHGFLNLPSLFDWFLLNYPYEKFLHTILLLVPLLLFLIWLLSYIYPKFKKDQPKTKYFIVDKFKWQVIINNKNSVKINKTPFCAKHDLRMIKGHFYYGCPEYPNSCTVVLSNKIHYETYSKALSHIEKEILESHH